MVKPLILSRKTGSVFFWNLSHNVGLNSPNQRDDVHLVQFAYRLLATNPVSQIKLELKMVYSQVSTGVDCSGREDDPLVKAIRAQQRARGAGAQDGKVSVIKGSDEFYDGTHTFLMNAFNNILFDVGPDQFPRIDRIAGCPSTVQEAVKACFAH